MCVCGLTGEADEHGSETQINRPSPGFSDPLAHGRKQNLGRHEKLHGETHEHTERVQDLHELIGPATHEEDNRTRMKPRNVQMKKYKRKTHVIWFYSFF